MSFSGHVQKGRVVVDQPLPLPDGTPVIVEPAVPTPADFWQSLSLDELAARQGVAAPPSPDELCGGWPADELDDGFEQAIGPWREQEHRG